MKNVKDEVFAALFTVSEHVSDTYPNCLMEIKLN